ncbi:MAG: signal peptidase I, partial [Gammaproteobacteria bacterium]|nr:signal peptidase I [Gammaproteobacteria bacterium]
MKKQDNRYKETIMKLAKYLQREVRDLPWLLIGVLLLARVGIAEANWIPTGSMQPTLPVGDFLVVDKTAYGFSLPFVDEAIVQWDEPEHGDIVTFDPSHTSDRLIKRVIGKSGDTVMVK